MAYLIWHYQQGYELLLRRIGFWFKRVWHYFSPLLLLKTLFWPWKRLSDTNEAGMNFSRIFEKITFNLISSGIGFLVRLTLIIFSLLTFVCLIPFSFLTILIWLFFPFYDIGTYFNERNRQENILEEIKNYAVSNQKSLGQYLNETSFGKFFQKRLPGINDVFMNLQLQHPENISDENSQKFIDSILLDSNLNELLKTANISVDDLKLTSKWLDKNQQNSDTNQKEKFLLNHSGIASELIFGYANFLKTYVDDMSLKQEFSEHLVGREEVVKRMETVLLTGKSVLLRGDEGVGKMTVVYEFAQRATTGQLDKSFLYHRVLSLNYEIALSETSDPDQKKTIMTKLISEAEAAGNIILVLRNFDRLVADSNYNYADVLIKAIDRKKIKIIGICNNKDFNETFINDSQILTYFEPVEVLPPNRENVENILAQQINDLERKNKITVTTSALRQIIDGSEQYITDTPFPEKALELLDEVVANNKKGFIDADRVNQIISQKTGIVITKLNELEKDKLANLEDIIHQNLINQKSAVDLIAKSLRARSVQIKSSERPVGSFLFLGPTGVGKTQTAKVLADTYFGSREQILRFDMAEYSGSDGLNRLIGFPGGLAGQLTTKIKENPSSLLLLDEFEKANSTIFNLFLTLLDEGYIMDADGNKIICKHLFVIATSNAGSEFIRKQVEKGVKGNALQESVIEFIQQNQIFSPEFLNRFDGVVVFEPLNQEQLIEVAKLQLKDLQENLHKNNNIDIEFDKSVPQKIVTDSYDINFGARPMRRTIDLVIADIIGKEIIKGNIIPGNKIKLITGSEKDNYSVQKI